MGKKNSSENIPSFQFYPNDWLNDLQLRLCSLPARGFLIDLVCLMYRTRKIGYLVNSDGDNFSDIELSRITGVTRRSVKKHLEELLGNNVLKRDEDGLIYSKRIVSDIKLRSERKKAGAMGGNPKLGVDYNLPGFIYLIQRSDSLVKIGISKNPEKRLYQIRKKLKLNQNQIDLKSISNQNQIDFKSKSNAKLVEKKWVENMGEYEKCLKEKCEQYHVDDGWYDLPKELIHLNVLLKVNSKVKPTPSSSSSSSSSLKEKPSKKKGGDERQKSKEMFDQFLDAYPKLKSIGLAEKEWIKINPDEKLFKIMLEKIEESKKYFTWRKENGRFIPYPDKWLRAKSWLDNDDNQKKSESLIGDQSIEKCTSFSLPVPKNHEASIMWGNALAIIEGQLSQETFEAFFLVTTSGYDIVDNKLVIAVPNEFFYNWLMEHYDKIIKAAIGNMEYKLIKINEIQK